MPFAPDHETFRDSVRTFVEREIAPHVNAWDEAGSFPRSLYRRAAEMGLLGLGYPESLGGTPADGWYRLVATEEIARAGSGGLMASLFSHSIGLPPIVAHGSQALQRRIVPEVLAGEKIAALAITEPGGGSDVAALTTRAVRDGDHYVVNGAKTFITSGCRADVVVTAVRTGGPGHGGISLLAIERGTPGFSVSARLRKMGWWASDTAELHFEDCRVPVGNVLGEVDQGFVTIMQNFATERVFLAAQCVAIATLAYQESVAYARERMAFGKALSGFQVTRHKLADMATRIAAARALTGEVVTRVLAGDMAAAGLAAMAKNTATDMCSAVCDAAVQIHGGYGYMRGYLVERLYRDARLYPIGGGTREIMNEIISKLEGY